MGTGSGTARLGKEPPKLGQDWARRGLGLESAPSGEVNTQAEGPPLARRLMRYEFAAEEKKNDLDRKENPLPWQS